MSILDHIAPEGPGAAVGSWMPARFTPSLTGTEEFVTDGDKLLAFAAKHFRTVESFPDVVTLDEWQRWLVRHVLERFPDDWPVAHLRGQLRWRKVVISIGRQNGKSLIEALFAIYFLCLHVRGPKVIGLASIESQAKIVYNRVKFAIDKSAPMSSVIKTTDTRGISLRDGTGIYNTIAAKEDSVQGEPASSVLYDELHLGMAALWDAMLLAMRSKKNALMVGITTAGDDDSALLIRLYAEGESALSGEGEPRMGFFVWEAPDDNLTEANVIAANPAIACGRVDLETAMDDARSMWADPKPDKETGLTGRQRVIRFTLNRFIEGAADSWTNTVAWNNTAAPSSCTDDLDQADTVVYSIERTEGWEWASIRATTRIGDRFATELVASIANPTPDLLADAADVLARNGHRAVFAVDRVTLDGLGRTIAERGHTVWRLTAAEMASASQHADQVIKRHVVTHPGDPLVRIQVARGRRRNTGEGGWRVSRELSGTDVDTVIGLVLGLYVAATLDEVRTFVG